MPQITLRTCLTGLAIICFCLSAAGISLSRGTGSGNLLAAGLALWALATIING